MSTVELSKDAKKLVDVLKKLCDLETDEEVVEQALTLLGWAAAEKQKGSSICSMETTLNEILLPALEAAERNSS